MHDLIDTHCHLDFFDNLAEILNQAAQKQVTSFIAPAVDVATSHTLLNLANQYPEIKVAIGLHPAEITERKLTSKAIQHELDELESILKTTPTTVVAIGECGLDFKYATSQEQQTLQIEAFRKQAALAATYHLPLIIHNRKANEMLLDILKGYSSTQAVFHCFASSKAFAKKLLDKNYFLGVGGLVTVDQGLQEIIKTIPIESILLETDAPYITPNPIKQTKPWPNEPANVYYVASALAELKQVSLENMAEQTTLNAHRLFRFP